MDILRLIGLFLEALEDLTGTVNRLRRLTPHEAREFLTEFRRAVSIAVLIPFILALTGGLIGGVLPFAKPYLVGTGAVLAVIFALAVAWNAIPATAIIAALIEAARSVGPRSGDLYLQAEKTAKFYINLIGATITNEAFIGAIVLIAPIHNRPQAIPYIILLSLVLISYVVWKGGMEWWPKIIYAVTVFLLVLTVASVFFPRQTARVQAFDMDLWIERQLIISEEPTAAAPAPRATEPDYVELPGGTIQIRPGVEFVVGRGSSIELLFEKAGLFFVDGEAMVESPSLVTLASGKKTREFEIDPIAHATRYGGPPCFYDRHAFRFVISPLYRDVRLRARLPGERCN